MNQNTWITPIRATSLTTSGVLSLWYLVDVELRRTDLLKGLGISDEQVLSWILLALVIFFAIASTVKTDSANGGIKLERAMDYLCPSFAIVSILLAIPKLISETPLASIGRIDAVVILALPVLLSIIYDEIRFSLEGYTKYTKLRERFQVQPRVFLFSGMLALGCVLLLALIMTYFQSDQTPIKVAFRITGTILLFVALLPFLSEKAPIFPEALASLIVQRLEEEERLKEIAFALPEEVVPKLGKGKGSRKRGRSLIRSQLINKQKGLFPRFEFLKEVKFGAIGSTFTIDVKECDDEDVVARITFRKKQSKEIVSEHLIKLKSLKEAAETIPAPTPFPKEPQNIFTPILFKALEIQEASKKSSEELCYEYAHSDKLLPKLKELVNSVDVDLNARQSDGWSCLLIATAEGQTKTVRYLLQQAANTEIKNKFGATPLFFAANYGFLEILTLLLDFHADPNTRENKRITPLMIAASHGHSAAVKVLVEAGADVNAKDVASQTALVHATNSKQGEIVRFLKTKAKS